MSRFAISNPYFIIVICLLLLIVGVTGTVRMPVDMFPNINIPVVVVATFFGGMPPEQIESNITSRFERFFTLGSGIDHIESRSLSGVSLIRVYFQSGFNPDAAVATISNLAMANLRRLPPGTLPPIVLRSDASSLPIALITFKGAGLNQTQLRDLAYYQVRTQVASVRGAALPQPFGGATRQLMIYPDPYKLESHAMSLMDVVHAVNESNLILPAGDVPIGSLDYNIYANAQAPDMQTINNIPLRTVGQTSVLVKDIATVKDAQAIQTNIVHVDGQRSVYVAVLKQGGETSTITVVEGVRNTLKRLVDIPKELITSVVFDQSLFIKKAIATLIHEGGLGLFLTSLLILIFLGSFRATLAVLFSIPLSAIATLLILYFSGSSINSMILGGLALAFSRLIDNSVVVLENIYRHLEMGETASEAAERGGREVALPVLAATITTIIVFFPVTFLFGVSKYLFGALALAVVISLIASYFVAMTVVPLYCANFIKNAHGGRALTHWFDRQFERFVGLYERAVGRLLRAPWAMMAAVALIFGVGVAIFPLLDVSFFPRTDAGMFLINVKAPSGTRMDLTEDLVTNIETMIRNTVAAGDLENIVSNQGVNADISAIYTTNSATHTAFIQVSLKEGHKIGSYEYMQMIREKLRAQMPQMTAYFQSGGLVDTVLNLGLPAPIDVQIGGSNIERGYRIATELSRKIRNVPNVSDVYIPQDLDYPTLKLDISRERAALLGMTERDVVNNVITALTSDAVIAPSFWIDPKSGNDYMLAVQYPERQIKNLGDLRAIPLRSANAAASTRLDMVSSVSRTETPTEIDRYQLRRISDIYVQTRGEDLGRVATRIDRLISETKLPAGVSITMRGMVQGMRQSFQSFGMGLILAVVLLFLILVAQFQSFLDPVLILLALPPGLTGAVVTLFLTGTTLNVMSLMGIIMMVGVSVSDSILIVEFTNRLKNEGLSVIDAARTAARVRLRPVLMTTLATLIGLLPMALKMGEGSEAYAPLARALCGGVFVSMVLTVFVVPCAYLIAYRRREAR